MKLGWIISVSTILNYVLILMDGVLWEINYLIKCVFFQVDKLNQLEKIEEMNKKKKQIFRMFPTETWLTQSYSISFCHESKF